MTLRHSIASFSEVSALLLLAGTCFGQDIVSRIETGCATEIKNYCSQVTPGEGRLLACFYAHQDKLSGKCEYALYDASAQLERAVSALNYVAGECRDDIVEHCADAQIGEGHVVQCLRSKTELVSADCTQALDDVFE